MSKTNYLQAVISDLQRTAGPYRCANNRHLMRGVALLLPPSKRVMYPRGEAVNASQFRHPLLGRV